MLLDDSRSAAFAGGAMVLALSTAHRVGSESTAGGTLTIAGVSAETTTLAQDAAVECAIDNFEANSTEALLAVGATRSLYDPSGVSWLVDTIGLKGAPGSGGIDIYQGDELILAKARSLEMRGTDVRASKVSDTRAAIYVPAPTYVSHLDTQDGTSDARITALATTLRKIAAPTTSGNPFWAGTWGGDGSAHPVVQNAAMTFAPAGLVSFDNTTSTLLVVVKQNNVVLASLETAPIAGNTSVAGSGITIAVSSWAADTDRFKASVSVGVNLTTILGGSGRVSVEITHKITSSQSYQFVQSEFFYDSKPATIAATGVSVEALVPVLKYISGVKYYTTGSTWTVSISDIDWLNANSYPTTQVSLTLTELAAANVNLAGPSLTGWTTAWDVVNVSYSGIATSSTNSQRRTGATKITAGFIDWTTATVDSSSLSILLDTYGTTSTATAEPFDDEARRLKANGTAWNSATALTSTDLMVYGGALRPQFGDWGTYAPSGQPDYSAGGAATQHYYRLYTDALVRSGGTFSFGTGAESLLVSDLDIAISLDGSTWFDATVAYLGGGLTNGAGCRVNADTVQMPQIAFTLGTLTTANASGLVPARSILVRISMAKTTSYQMPQCNLTWA